MTTSFVDAEGASQIQDSTARDALERRIIETIRAAGFTYSELATVAVRVHRLAKAKPDYGDLDLANDKRDFEVEAAFEGVDRAWYKDAKLVFDHDPAFADVRALRRAERAREFKERMQCAVADAEFAINNTVDATFEIRDGRILEILPPGAEVQS
jgi:hypothetical protein